MNKEIGKNFYIIEARDLQTNQLEKRRIYTTESQYNSIGSKQIEKFNKKYKVKVTKYICDEHVEILNQKPTPPPSQIIKEGENPNKTKI